MSVAAKLTLKVNHIAVLAASKAIEVPVWINRASLPGDRQRALDAGFREFLPKPNLSSHGNRNLK
jgi:hypothetical protein